MNRHPSSPCWVASMRTVYLPLLQRDIGTAEQQFAPTQMPIGHDAAPVGQRHVQRQLRTQVLCSDRTIGRVEPTATQAQLTDDAQRLVRGCVTMSRPATVPPVMRPSDHACDSNAWDQANGTCRRSMRVTSGVAASRWSDSAPGPRESLASVRGNAQIQRQPERRAMPAAQLTRRNATPPARSAATDNRQSRLRKW